MMQAQVDLTTYLYCQGFDQTSEWPSFTAISSLDRYVQDKYLQGTTRKQGKDKGKGKEI